MVLKKLQRLKGSHVILAFMALLLLTFTGTNSWGGVTAKLTKTAYKAGSPITITGQIQPGNDLFVVVCNNKLFRPQDSKGAQERAKLAKLFGDTAIPPIYYLITNVPQDFATPEKAMMGQTKGPFAFPPFKFAVMVNKIKKWNQIPNDVKSMLGPITTPEQWKFLIYAHEKKFGINTISKERPIGGGNARMILSDYNKQPEAWNKGVHITLDKATGKFKVTMTPYKNIAPGTLMAVYVNGQKVSTFKVLKSGFFFKTANTYVNPLIVFFGALLIGILFVVMGAAGGLFTAAFQITVLGTRGPVGINAANTVKPTNLFLTLCSPISGLINYFKDKRFAWPLALFFALGIFIGAFFIGPTFSAKYLPMKAYKFYLGILCLVIGLKLFHESLPSTIEKKKALKAIVQKFNKAVEEAKKTGKAADIGRVEFDKFNLVKFDMRFWGETFVARPMVMFLGGIIMGMIAASFGVGGGFMFMPFMTSIMGYPMYLAVPIALTGTFATSIGGISKYILLGYSPDWLMAACIAGGAICGGMIGPKIQKKLPEIFLKRLLAIALIIVFMKYTKLLWFMR